MSKFFPSTENYFLDIPSEDRASLLRMMNVLESIGSKAYWLESYIAYLSCLLTFLQLIVLTRKQMMTSSINSLMIGVSICDNLAMQIVIFFRNPLDDDSEFICQAPYSLSESYILIHSRSFRILVRRCTCWMGVLMAVFRYSIIRTLKSSKKLSSSKFGFKVVLATCSAASVLFLGALLEYSYYTTEYWIPPIQCTQYPSGTFIPIYKLGISELFLKWHGLLLIVYGVSDAVLSKLIPCILLPILTVLLLLQVRKSNRVNAMAGVTTISDMKRKSDRTTFLVIFMTITFILCEFPLSIASCLRSVYSTNVGIDRIGELIYFICNCIFTTNASIHCIIYFIMSSQYRRTVAVLLRIQKKDSSNNVSNVGDALITRI